MGGCLSSPYAAKAGAGAPDGGAVPNSRFEQAKATRRPSEKRRNRLESQLIEAVKDHCANPTVKLKTMNSILMKVRTYARLAALVLRLLKGTADGTGGTRMQPARAEGPGASPQERGGGWSPAARPAAAAAWAAPGRWAREAAGARAHSSASCCTSSSAPRAPCRRAGRCGGWWGGLQHVGGSGGSLTCQGGGEGTAGGAWHGQHGAARRSLPAKAWGQGVCSCVTLRAGG